jgi:transcriptional regulator with XRE-family HTH domain
MATNLRTAREHVGMTAAALAYLVDVSPSTISRLEHGLRLPMHETAQRLEEVLGCTLKFTRVTA